MSDLLDLLLTCATDPAEETHLHQAVGAHVKALLASAGKAKRSLVAQAEKMAQRNPAAAFAFDATGSATLSAAAFGKACQQLLRAAYLGTLLAATSLARKRVVLTLIGGGVFRNPVSLIWDAIVWAVDEVQPFLSHDLDVIVNGYHLGRLMDLSRILPAVRARGGAILMFDTSALATIRR
jgi:O-acetyl-ADP-ribose deacetylase (regulator of RNase III)